jgi:colicin import membrane protein
MTRYIGSITISFFLHAIIIAGLLWSSKDKFVMPAFIPASIVPEQSPEESDTPDKELENVPDIVESVAVDVKQLEKEISRINNDKQRKKAKEERRKRLIKERQEKAKRDKAKAIAEKKRKKEEAIKQARLEAERIAEEKRVKQQEAELAEQKVQQELIKKKQQEMEAQRKAQEKKQKEAQEKKRKEAARKKKEQEERKQKEEEQRLIEEAMLEQMMLDEINQESLEINSSLSQRIRDEMQLYQAKIQAKITSKWRKPRNEYGSCAYTIRLAPGGALVDVIDLGGPTCTENIRRTGRAAILASDPLPMSSESEVFNEMREITFTVTSKESD